MKHTLAFAAILILASVMFSGIAQSDAAAPRAAAGIGAATDPYTGRGALSPVVSAAERYDTSLPLTVMKISESLAPNGDAATMRHIPRPIVTPSIPITDPVVQPVIGPSDAPTSAVNFEGVNNVNGVLPPDTVGAVGLRHYVQMVNLSFAVYTKTTGALAFGPKPTNLIWSGFGGPCESTNDGDPIVLYDKLADRWLISQFANIRTNGPYYECIAVSATSNPAGAYHRYAFKINDTKLNDYPKLAVWPDGYYLTVNQFAGSGWGGAGVAVYERDRMLAGQSARQVYFDLFSISPDFGGMLPSDWDGYALPPAGAPNYFTEVDDAGWWGGDQPPVDQLRIWEFHVDWADTSRSTFGLQFQPNWILDTAPFDSNLCNYSPNCLPQPGTTARVDAISDRLMFRLAYRNFGTHEALAVNHTVNAGAGRAGVRWYELRRTGADWSIFQQGTFAPDAANRWMGSLAMDAEGNMALGYSAGSATVYPSIRYTGRLAGDTPGAMTAGEATLVAGSGSQTSSSYRWGDYSAMTVDPVDDCTFWYTNEYYAVTSDRGWQTRIGAFRMPGCERGLLSGVVTDAVTLAPVGGAVVSVEGGGFSSTYTFTSTSAYTTTTRSDGTFRINPRGGIYTVTVNVSGYAPATITSVAIVTGAIQTLPVILTPSQTHVVSGVVSDSPSGQPLAALVRASGRPGDPPITSTTANTNTGFYSLTLPGGQAYTLTASAFGHRSDTRAIGVLVASRTENFRLWRQWWLLPVLRP